MLRIIRPKSFFKKGRPWILAVRHSKQSKIIVWYYLWCLQLLQIQRCRHSFLYVWAKWMFGILHYIISAVALATSLLWACRTDTYCMFEILGPFMGVKYSVISTAVIVFGLLLFHLNALLFVMHSFKRLCHKSAALNWCKVIFLKNVTKLKGFWKGWV